MMDFNLGFTLFLIVLPIAIAAHLTSKAVKNDDKLRDNLKEVAKHKGQEALVKGIEWLLKKK